MKLILHIGTEKTGTTSFQRFCHLNRDSLLQQGVLYPVQLGDQNHRFLSMYALSLETADDGIRGMGINTEDAMAAFYKEVEVRIWNQLRDSSEASLCILSSEHFHSRLRDPGQIARLHSLLAPLFDEIEVCVHLRPQVEVAISLASTQSRVGGAVRKGFFDQVTAKNTYYNYDSLVGMWEQVFGATSVTCIPFNTEPDFLKWLCGRVGINRTGLPIPARLNEALDVSVMAMINALVDSGTSQRIHHCILDTLPVEAKLTIGCSQAQAIQSRFTVGNQALIDRRPELSSGQLQPDWSRYPEEGNLDLLDTPCTFSRSFASLVGKYENEISRLRDSG